MNTATAEAAPAPTAQHQIAITPDPTMRGRKAIMVDGVRWGTIHMQSAGANGAYYWFQQEGGHGELCRTGEKYWKGSNLSRQRPVKVWGDKTAMRQAGVSRSAVGAAAEAQRAAFPSLDDRLMTEARKLIGEGVLRHPDAVKADQANASAAYRVSEAKREADELAAFEAKAAECLAPIEGHIGDNMKAAMVADIVKAMRWAQTK